MSYNMVTRISYSENWEMNAVPLAVSTDLKTWVQQAPGLTLIGSPPQPATVDMGADEYCLLKGKKTTW